MYGNVFLKEGERRANPDEIAVWCRQTLDITPVEGFLGFVEGRGHCEVSDRVSSFLEMPWPQAWYIHQNVEGHMTWETGKVPDTIHSGKVAFIFAMGVGNGSPLPQPTGEFELYLDDKYLLSFHVVKHSWSWRVGDIGFHFDARRIEAAPPNCFMYLDSHIREESWAAYGPGVLCLPASMVVLGRSHTIRVVPVNRHESTQWFQVAGHKNMIGRTDFFQCVKAAAVREYPQVDGYNVYFGDIHTHSAETVHGTEGCGYGSIDDNYRYARDIAGLDIYALTDHDYQMNPEYAENYMKRADAYNEDGKFVTIPAFEFTSFMWGHRNVYYRSSEGKVISAHRGWSARYWDASNQITPYELWNELDKLGIDAITIPHHPSATSHPLTWDVYSPKYDRLVEVYSCWGSSEYYGDYPRGVSDRYRGLYVREALNRGYRMGLIASSDGHDGHPGNAQSPYHKHHHTFHPLGSGWIAVLSPALTRNDVFDSMYSRRCYGTTGVPIVLDFRINGDPMGSELQISKGEPVSLDVYLKGTNGIDHVRIVKNGRVVQHIPGYGEWEMAFEWLDEKRGESVTDYYYIRVVQKDMESAWSSPIWVTSR